MRWRGNRWFFHGIVRRCGRDMRAQRRKIITLGEVVIVSYKYRIQGRWSIVRECNRCVRPRASCINRFGFSVNLFDEKSYRNSSWVIRFFFNLLYLYLWVILVTSLYWEFFGSPCHQHCQKFTSKCLKLWLKWHLKNSKFFSKSLTSSVKKFILRSKYFAILSLSVS